MANEGIYIRLWQVGPAPRTSILLNDIEVGEGGMKWAGRGGFPRSGAVYVPTTGVVELSYTSTVAVSYESGSIGGFITRGLLAYEFRVGLAFTDAVMRNRGWENYEELRLEPWVREQRLPDLRGEQLLILATWLRMKSSIRP